MPSRKSYVVTKRGGKKSSDGGKGHRVSALATNTKGSLPIMHQLSGSRPVPPKPVSPASTFWEPIRSFALSQITSLVRRSTLRESDFVAPKYEKVHNFKVSEKGLQPHSLAFSLALALALSNSVVSFSVTFFHPLSFSLS